MNTPTLIIIIPKAAGIPWLSKSNNILNFGLKHCKYRYSLNSVL